MNDFILQNSFISTKLSHNVILYIILLGGACFMENLSEINKKVSSTLREENNAVVYTAWLSFTEEAQLEDGNIVINVPNPYIKETLEERYNFDIEELYRNEIAFSKLIIRTEAEQITNAFKKANNIEYVNMKVLNAFEKIMLSSNDFKVSL
jgi:chromosomal replication initiation ATPase DnaA